MIQHPSINSQAQAPAMHNKSFARLVSGTRHVLPYIAFAALIGVYIVCAIVEGKFIGLGMRNIPGNVWIGIAIGSAIQITRGVLVFFPQLNPNRPIMDLRGEIMAGVMGAISVYSIVGLANTLALSAAVATSLGVLMAAGIGVEIYLLKEIRFYSEIEMFRNRAWWENLQHYYRARRDFKRFVDNLHDEEDASAMGARSSTAPLPGRDRARAAYARIRERRSEASNGAGSKEEADAMLRQGFGQRIRERQASANATPPAPAPINPVMGNAPGEANQQLFPQEEMLELELLPHSNNQAD